MAAKHLNRRRLLATTGALAAGLLAGCSSGDGDDAEPTPDDSETPTPTPEPEPTEAPEQTEAGAGEVDREIGVTMRSFEFEPGSEEPITVTAGETVRICATAEDDGIGGGHGLGILEFDVSIAPVVQGEEKCAVFTPEEPGEYRMQCTVQCSQPGAGTGHEDMVGTFVVEEA